VGIVGNEEEKRVSCSLTVSISITVLNAFSDTPEIGAKKFPAAPKKVDVHHDHEFHQVLVHRQDKKNQGDAATHHK
jgi:hypothetical protein